jgi:hypothetical protein
MESLPVGVTVPHICCVQLGVHVALPFAEVNKSVGKHLAVKISDMHKARFDWRQATWAR